MKKTVVILRCGDRLWPFWVWTVFDARRVALVSLVSLMNGGEGGVQEAYSDQEVDEG